MKKVFLDTNILLDLVQHRDGFYHAVSVLQGAYEKQYDIYAYVLSYANIAYVLRKELANITCLIGQLNVLHRAS